MQKRFIVLTAAIALLAMSSQAQQAYKNNKMALSIVTGVNFQTFSTKVFNNNAAGNKLITGFHIGANTELKILPHLYFQPGLLYTTKGNKGKEYVYSSPRKLKIRISYFEMPVNFLYKHSLCHGSLLFGIGPYLAAGISGKRVSDFFGNQTINFKSPISMHTHNTETYFKRLDAGVNLLLGYELTNRTSFKLNAQQGLTKNNSELTDYDLGKYGTKNIGFSISIAYRFFN